MTKLIMTQGLSGSGKTTKVIEFIQNEIANGNLNVMNVNRDDIRRSNGMPLFAGQYENTVTKIQNGMIRDGLKKRMTVISSDTNLNVKYANKLLKIGEHFGAEIEVWQVDTPLEECIRRDALRPGGVGEEVIRKQYKYFVNGKMPTLSFNQGNEWKLYIPDLTLPDAYIWDIDGTLAKLNGRSPYDYSQVSTDLPHSDVIDLMFRLTKQGTHNVFLSGREDSCRADTEAWLRRELDWSGELELYMRRTGDDRNDALVKNELFWTNLADRYNVLGWFDDRRQVIDMVRSIGIRCYDVAGNDF